MKRKWIIMILVLCMVITIIPVGVLAADVSSYKDVDQKSWYVPYVDYVVKKGLMSGTSQSGFEPNGAVTRAQYVQVLYALAGKPVVKEKSGFRDVKSGAWYDNAVNWAASAGVTGGLTKTTFAPNQKVTREQAATFFKAYASKQAKLDTSETADLSAYPDVATVSNYAKENMRWAVGAKLISGIKSNDKALLVPKGTLTRAQLATMMKAFDLLLFYKTGKGISRLQWIKLLNKEANVNVKAEDIAEVYNFTDIADRDDLLQVESALSAGALKLEDYSSGKFMPNDPATREFAVATSVDMLGCYAPDIMASCNDSGDVKKKNQIGIALKLGMTTLKDGKFYPNEPISPQEANELLKKFAENNKDEEVVPRDPEISLQDNVIQLDDVAYTATWNAEGQKYEVSVQDTGGIQLKKGQTIVLPKTEEHPAGLSLVIQTNPTILNKSVSFEGVVPEADQVFKELNVAGKESLDSAKTIEFLPAEGVELVPKEELEKETADNLQLHSVGTESAKIKAAVEAYNHKDGSKGYSISLAGTIADGLSVVGEVKIDQFDIDYDITSVKPMNAYVKTRFSMQPDFQLKLSTGGGSLKDWRKAGATREIKIAKLNLGVFISAYLYLFIDGQGKVLFRCSLDGTSVFSYKNGICKHKFDNLNLKVLDTQMQAKLEFGPEVGAAISCFGIPAVDVNLFAGFGMKGTVEEHPDNFYCLSAVKYIPLMLSVGKHSVFKSLVGESFTWKFWDENKSIFRREQHLESTIASGGEFVRTKNDKCTWNSSTNNNKNTGQDTNKNNNSNNDNGSSNNGSIGPQYGWLKGTVKYGTKPVSGADVKVYGVLEKETEYKLLWQGKTDSNGNFNPTNDWCPNGQWVDWAYVVVSAPGYLVFTSRKFDIGVNFWTVSVEMRK